jgi:hypothetical protein
MIIDKSFKWPVAASYEIKEPPEHPKRSGSRGWAKWSRTRAADTIAAGGEPSGPSLVAKGPVLWKCPFRIGAKLSQELVRLIDANPEDKAFVQFASKCSRSILS